jgi:hypothetical protein
MVSSSPAMAVSAASGRAAKSMTLVAGSRVSRPAVAGLTLVCSAAERIRRPKPSSVRIWPTPVRFSGVPRAQPGADLVHRQAGPAQLDDAGVDPVLGWGGLGAGPTRRREQIQLAAAVVTHQ